MAKKNTTLKNIFMIIYTIFNKYSEYKCIVSVFMKRNNSSIHCLIKKRHCFFINPFLSKKVLFTLFNSLIKASQF